MNRPEQMSPQLKITRTVNAALETPLSEGLKQERLYFQPAFATEGQKEGMNAFVHKRAPVLETCNTLRKSRSD
jgi:enoyl-CoA hydratase